MTTQAMTRYETAPLAPIVTDEQLELVRRTVANGATDAELQLYLYDCQRHGVHPLDKLLHFTKRDGKYTPITSIDLLRSRASDTGELGGIDDPIYSGEIKGSDFAATVTVYRFVQGQRCPFSATARWLEYKPNAGSSGRGDVMWQKMPHLMLGKCAEALALRKAFPRQLAGLYASEEMDQASNSGATYSAPQALPPAPVANKATGEVVDAPASDDPKWPPACPICGTQGKPSRFKEGYYCPNKAMHGGKFYDIPWPDSNGDDLFPEPDITAEYDEIDAALDNRK